MSPKILVISNECFSKTSSNGRTLGNFFIDWPKNCIAQFYLSGVPDFDYCENYFCVSDGQALNAIKCSGNIGGLVSKGANITYEKSLNGNSENHTVRNAITMLIRNMIWSTGAWKKSGFDEWVKAYQPDIVLLQAGDCAFMFDIAVHITKQAKAKLVIYNSEAYYYKNYDYFRSTGIAHAIFPMFKKQLCKAVERAYAMASCVIYTCDELREQYEKDFVCRAETVFTGSDVIAQKKQKQNETFTTVYCGNLGIKRHESLIEIANVLQEINSGLLVDVYGKASDAVKEEFANCKGIRFHGIVPYEEVKYILRECDLMLYVESFDEFYQEDIKFGFSTKIADSLSSGNCLLLYSPEHFACYQYLMKNQAAYTASNKTELKRILANLLEYPKLRIKYQSNALELAELNHSITKNNKKFRDILYSVVMGE